MKTLQKPEGSWNQREGGGYASRSRSGLCLCDAVCCSLECIGIASGISEQWREFNPVTDVYTVLGNRSLLRAAVVFVLILLSLPVDLCSYFILFSLSCLLASSSGWNLFLFFEGVVAAAEEGGECPQWPEWKESEAGVPVGSGELRFPNEGFITEAAVWSSLLGRRQLQGFSVCGS